MVITERVAIEVAHHEAIVREAYLDSVGVWTWSVGLTSKSGHKVERYRGNPQTLERCLEVYLWALERYAADVREAMDGRDITEAQFAAALSFHWNTGAIGKATWVRSWLDGQDDNARREIMNWSTPPEIIKRRRAEQALFFDGEWSNTDGRGTIYRRVRPSGYVDWGSAERIDLRGRFPGLKSAKPKAATWWTRFIEWLRGV